MALINKVSYCRILNFTVLWIIRIYIFPVIFAQTDESLVERKFLDSNCRNNNCSYALNFCIQDQCNSVSQCQNCIDNIHPECSECSKDIYGDIPVMIDGKLAHLCDVLDDSQVLACRYFCRGNFGVSGDCVQYSNSFDICDCSANTVNTTPQTILSTTSFNTTTEPIPSGTLIRTFGNHRDQIWSLELLSNGFVAAADKSGDIKIWNPNNGELVRLLANHTAGVYGLKLLSNGYLASSSDDRKIIIWNVNNGNIVKFIENDFATSSLETLLDDTLVAGGFDGKIRLYNQTDLSLISIINAHTRNVRALRLLPNGNFASASWDYSVKLWNTTNNFSLISSGGHVWNAFDLDLIHDGNLVSGGWDSHLRIWDSTNGNSIFKKGLYQLGVHAIKYLNNNRLAVAAEIDQIRIFNTNNWILTKVSRSDSTGWYTSLELLSNGNLISGSADGFLRIWQF